MNTVGRIMSNWWPYLTVVGWGVIALITRLSLRYKRGKIICPRKGIGWVIWAVSFGLTVLMLFESGLGIAQWAIDGGENDLYALWLVAMFYSCGVGAVGYVVMAAVVAHAERQLEVRRRYRAQIREALQAKAEAEQRAHEAEKKAQWVEFFAEQQVAEAQEQLDNLPVREEVVVTDGEGRLIRGVGIQCTLKQYREIQERRATRR